MSELMYRRPFKVEKRNRDDDDNSNRAYYRAIISDDSMDSHYSKMSQGTLENFARESQKGVTILDSHNHRSAGIGTTVSGSIEDNKVYADFYSVKDVPLQGQSYSNTDAMIKMIDDGAVKDVSVGFYGHSEKCNMCGQDLWTGDCMHWPGMKYEIEKDGIKRIETATTTIEDGHLSEVSVVYDGANEHASILSRMQAKAERLAPRLSTREKQQITQMYNVEFKDEFKSEFKDDKKEPVTVPKTNDRSNFNMSTNNTDERYAQLEEANQHLEERAELAERKVENFDVIKAERDNFEKRLNASRQSQASLQKMHDEKAAEVKVLEEKVASLEPGAKAFEVYKEEEVEKAMNVRVSAFVDEDKGTDGYERAKKLLQNQKSVEDIRTYVIEWEKIAKANFPGGDQIPQGTDQEDDEPPETDNTIPSKDAYQVEFKINIEEIDKWLSEKDLTQIACR